MNASTKISLRSFWPFLILIFTGLLADQASKLWAVDRFTDEQGRPNYETVEVIGSTVRFILAYNEGAAFSSRPQAIAPWLHPTLFFGTLTAVALAALLFFFKSLPTDDYFSRWGTAMIISGAMGNLTDRLRIHKVVDFIDVDFPDFIMSRWPTFNIADSLVSVGVTCVILGPIIVKRLRRTSVAAGEPTT